ncbi:MAG: alkylated DNA repair dioxygenase AlkB [Cocleimonas sp.]|jgi:alkylated DNA repair dioxygenase AlkB
MNLFGFDQQQNILPEDGEVYYFGNVISDYDSQRLLFTLLKDIFWEHDELVIYGKKITTKRKTAWYGDNELKYSYSNTTKVALPWVSVLTELKEVIERQSQTTFNSCLLNLYHGGDEGMSWHSDDEKELGNQPIIASLSIGAERKFSFKHKKSKESVSLPLEDGSLLIMKADTQKYWQHSLPKTTKVSEPRINLTFRTILS